MKNRMFKRIVLASAALSLWANAQTCNAISVFDGSSVTGKMEETLSTFPESPEWTANWGDMDGMKAPYLRFSGQKSFQDSWKGSFIFNSFPLKVEGGALKLKVRSTQNAKFGVWLVSANTSSAIAYRNISANQTQSLEIPLSELKITAATDIQKIGFGLFDVPAYQYTTFFVDDITFSCSAANATGLTSEDEEEDATYTFTSVDPASPNRPNLTGGERFAETEMKLSADTRNQYRQKTTANFVISENEHHLIREYQSAQTLTPKKSREGWYKSLYFINANRLKDSVVANPKNVYLEASATAAGFDNRQIPVLVADLDYDYKVCIDTACNNVNLEHESLLLAALPVTHVEGSAVKFIYDPNFTVTTRHTLPVLEICAENKCQTLHEKEIANVEFESAGLKKIVVKLSSQNKSVQQNLFVEVQ